MFPFVAAQVNDSLFAAIIGTSFTACLALMAWIVKSLITISGRLDGIDIRLGRVEESSNGARRNAPRSR